MLKVLRSSQYMCRYFYAEWALCSTLQHVSLIVLCATSGVARETFRKTFKEENPDVKGVTAVS
jgi:hypothetical protein